MTFNLRHLTLTTMAKQQITEEEVRRIAQLARLGLSDDEVARATQDLQGVLDHFSTIQAIDTEGVPMASDASGLKNVAREDEAAAEALAAHAEVLERAPERKDGQLKVKAIFD